MELDPNLELAANSNNNRNKEMNKQINNDESFTTAQVHMTTHSQGRAACGVFTCCIRKYLCIFKCFEKIWL